MIFFEGKVKYEKLGNMTMKILVENYNIIMNSLMIMYRYLLLASKPMKPNLFMNDATANAFIFVAGNPLSTINSQKFVQLVLNTSSAAELQKLREMPSMKLESIFFCINFILRDRMCH